MVIPACPEIHRAVANSWLLSPHPHLLRYIQHIFKIIQTIFRYIILIWVISSVTFCSVFLIETVRIDPISPSIHLSSCTDPHWGKDKDTRLDFLKEEIRVAKLLDHPTLGKKWYNWMSRYSRSVWLIWWRSLPVSAQAGQGLWNCGLVICFWFTVYHHISSP